MTLALQLPLRGSRLIEASAGTGKTFTIAFAYVRVVLEHISMALGCSSAARGFDRPLLPPDILVVTFTEAAAAELKWRIRERLVAAAEAFRADPAAGPLAGSLAGQGADPLLAELRAGLPAEHWPACARQLTLAAEWMDEAAVSTIHAWALRMLQEHAFDSASLFQQTLVPDLSEQRREAVRDYWRVLVAPLGRAEMGALRDALAEGPDALEQRLRLPLQRAEAHISYAGERIEPGQVRQALSEMGRAREAAMAAQTQARSLYREQREALRDTLRTLRPVLNGAQFRGKDSHLGEWLEELHAWAIDAAPASAFVARLGAQRIKLNKGGDRTLVEGPFFQAVDHWQDALAACEADGPRLRALLLADATAWVRERLAGHLAERAELGFDDLLRRLDRALAGPRGPALAARIRGRFPVAMIDEFQDTDAVQYRIFDRIYAVASDAPDTAIVLIGDPKQAIYSFRGADIRTYLRARRAAAARLHNLDTNYRSTTAMVAAVNGLFTRAEAHRRGAFRFRDGDENPVPFMPVQANGRAERLTLGERPRAGLIAWSLCTGQALRAGPHRALMAAHAAEQIVCWLNDARSGFSDASGFRRLRPADIAILVRNRGEAAAVRAELRARRLDSVYLSDRDSVFECAEARDLLRWLQACAEPDDERCLREALASATLGLPLATLHGVQQDESLWQFHQDRFAGYRRQWRRFGVLPMLRRLLHDYQVPRRLLAGADGERRLTDLLHLLEWAQQMSLTLDGEAALTRALAEHIVDPPGDQEVIRLESDAELIQVVTIYKAKGLEYPLVVLPFASDWREVSARQTEVAWRADDDLYIEVGAKAAAESALRQADDERLSEEVRLLYVALTRARHATFLGVAPLAPGSVKAPQVHRGALGYLLKGGEPFEDEEALVEHLRALQGAGLPLEVEAVELDPARSRFRPRLDPSTPRPARRPTHPAFPSWWIASFSALTRDALRDAEEAPAETRQDARRDEALPGAPGDEPGPVPVLPPPGRPRPGSMHAFPKGREPGTFLHGLIEWCAARGFASALDDPRCEAEIARRCQVRGWARHAGTVKAWLAQLMATPFAVGDGPALCLDRLARHRVEQEFCLAVHDADVGKIDALITATILPGVARAPLGAAQLNGLLTGFIDLVVEHQGRFHVIDWKSNWLGPDARAYDRAAMEAALLAKRYDVQLSLYLLALHRHLRQRLADYDYARHVGGALLVFLRGLDAPTHGLLGLRPACEFVTALDALLGAPGAEAAAP